MDADNSQTPDPGFQRPPRSRAVERAFAVLETLADHEQALTLSQLARHTEVPASSLLAIMRSLRASRAVRMTTNRKYVLDSGVARLGQACVEHDPVVWHFDAVARLLRERFDETSQLGVLAGDQLVYIARMEPTRTQRRDVPAPRRLPARESTAGMALLAWTGAEDERLQKQRDDVRRRGFAQSTHRCVPGSHCIAVPIFNATAAPRRRPVGDLPVERVNRRLQVRVADDLLQGSRDMTSRLRKRSPGPLQRRPPTTPGVQPRHRHATGSEPTLP